MPAVNLAAEIERKCLNDAGDQCSAMIDLLDREMSQLCQSLATHIQAAQSQSSSVGRSRVPELSIQNPGRFE